jgi:tetratricopeptide (TPR) repeat protein
MSRVRCVIFLLAVTVTAEAQTRPDASALARALVGSDYARARGAEDQILELEAAQAASIALMGRGAASSPLMRQRCERVLEAVVEPLIEDLSRHVSIEGFAAPIGLGGAAGVVVSGQLRAAPGPRGGADLAAFTPEEIERRAGVARRALAAIGPAVCAYLERVPPVRSLEASRRLRALSFSFARAVVEGQRGRAQSSPESVSRELEALGHNTDLFRRQLLLGLADKDAALRSIYRSFRDRLLTSTLSTLGSSQHSERARATELLFALPELSLPRLQTLAADGAASSAGARAGARKLAHRVRFRISEALYAKLGTLYSDYERRSFRERRRACLEIARLGGTDAVPSLRAILRLETSREVRLAVALCLARLGDPVGIVRLQREGLSLPVTIPQADRVAIFMDQGLRYLTIGRFRRAEKEFLRIIALESGNDTALYNLACTYALWGRQDDAMGYLYKAVRSGFDDVSHIQTDPDLASLREDPRYVRLVTALKAGQAVPPLIRPDASPDQGERGEGR